MILILCHCNVVQAGTKTLGGGNSQIKRSWVGVNDYAFTRKTKKCDNKDHPDSCKQYSFSNNDGTAKWVHVSSKKLSSSPQVEELNVYCLFHNVEADGSENANKSVRYKIAIDRNEITTDGKWGNLLKDGSLESTHAGSIAFVISCYKNTDSTYYRDDGNPKGFPGLWQTPSQWCIWDRIDDLMSACKDIWESDFARSRASIESLYKDGWEGFENRVEWLRAHYDEVKKLRDMAKAYGDSINKYEDPVNKKDSTIKGKQINTNKVYGPFEISFTSTKSGGKWIGGLYQVKVDGASEFYVCNANGVIKGDVNTIKPNTEFYIAVPKSSNPSKITFTFRHLNCKATFLDISGGTGGKQQQMAVTEYSRKWITKNVEINLECETIPNETVLKYAKDTNRTYKIGGIKLGYKNWKPDVSKYKTKPQKPKKEDFYEGEVLNQAKYDAACAEYEDWLDNYNYYKKSQSNYVATGTTNNQGKATITGDIRAGTYDIYEISSTNLYFRVPTPKKVKSGHRPGTTEKIDNPRTHVDVEGWIWEEPSQGADNLMSNSDRKVRGVLVELKLNGSRVNSVAVQSDGHYKFQYLEVDKLDKYTIEVTYNGMLYKSIPLKLSSAKGSKMSDIQSVRDSLNNQYSTITKNTGGIKYSQSDYKSVPVFESQYSGIQDKASVQKCTGYNVRASTENAGYNIKNGYKAEKDCITNVNLGLVAIDQPDIELVKDVEKIKVSINGQNHVYQYGSRLNDEVFKQEIAEQGEKNAFEVEPKNKYKSGSKYGNMTYTRSLYAADIAYGNIGENQQNKLKVAVTYKIGIKNQQSKLRAKINSIIDYYDSKYEDTIEAGMKINDDGTINGTKLSTDINTSNKTLTIKDMNLTINEGKAEYLYVRLQVKEQEVVKLLNGGSLELNNTAEITSYTTLDLQGKKRAGIDTDSQPENTVLNNQKTYEDDTDKAPKVQLLLLSGNDKNGDDERLISGTVFEDETTVDDSGIRQGNGIFDNNFTNKEKTIKDVEVSVYEYKQKNGKKERTLANYYDSKNKQWIPAKYTTRIRW